MNIYKKSLNILFWILIMNINNVFNNVYYMYAIFNKY
jgi:hypothetical protein